LKPWRNLRGGLGRENFQHTSPSRYTNRGTGGTRVIIYLFFCVVFMVEEEWIFDP